MFNKNITKEDKKRINIIVICFMISIVISLLANILDGMRMPCNITDSISTMSPQEIEAFNNNFEDFKGSQTGSQISSLIGELISNSNIFPDEPNKVPDLYINKVSFTEDNTVNASYNASNNTNELYNYINELSKVRNGVELKHTYNVSLEYNSDGLICKIVVEY